MTAEVQCVTCKQVFTCYPLPNTIGTLVCHCRGNDEPGTIMHYDSETGQVLRVSETKVVSP